MAVGTSIEESEIDPARMVNSEKFAYAVARSDATERLLGKR